LKDAEENTSSLSANVAQKLKRKPLSQILESLRTALRRLPKKITANHPSEEKRDNPEQRLKLNIESPFIKPKLIRMSEKTLMKNIANPKSKPTTSPLKESMNGKIANVPPSEHITSSRRINVFPDGKTNSDE